MNRGIFILLLTIAAQLAMTGCRDKKLSTERADVIRAKLERFFGRKLRTWEEAEEDLNAKRRLEFPAYVATPEGIRECWTKAEEEEAKKRVK